MQPKLIPHDPPRIYSKACVCGNFIFLADEDCKDPKTQEVRGSTVAEQAEYLFQNLKATLESLGSSLDNVVSLTTYITGPRGADGSREARRKYLPHSPPSALIMGIHLS